MSVHDAELGDIYVDGAGKLWRVIAICGEPTVRVQEVESLAPGNALTMNGGISGYMWHGFRRIYRPRNQEAAQSAE